MTEPRPTGRGRDKTDLAVGLGMLFAVGAVALAVYLVVSGTEGTQAVGTNDAVESEALLTEPSTRPTSSIAVGAESPAPTATSAMASSVTAVSQPPAGEPLQATLSGDTVVLSGTIPDNAMELRIIESVEQVFGQGSVDADLVVDPAVEPPTSMKLTVADSILFDPGSTDIAAAFTPLLDRIADLMAGEAGANLVIVGHTDTGGDPISNLALSQRRAEAARSYLVVNQGIDGFRIEAFGRGDTEPLTDNETAEGRQRNRRIEFELVSMSLAG